MMFDPVGRCVAEADDDFFKKALPLCSKSTSAGSIVPWWTGSCTCCTCIQLHTTMSRVSSWVCSRGAAQRQECPTGNVQPTYGGSCGSCSSITAAYM